MTNQAVTDLLQSFSIIGLCIFVIMEKLKRNKL